MIKQRFRLFFQALLVLMVFFIACQTRKIKASYRKAELLETSSECSIQNCTKCKPNEPYSCEICQEGKTCCSPFCQKCSSIDSTTCDKCYSGFLYNLTSNTCYLQNSCQQQDCGKCSEDVKYCIECKTSSSMNPYTKYCTKCYPQCFSCNYTTDCLSCNPHYYLEDNRCLICDQNCQECLEQSYHCISCDIGRYLDLKSFTCLDCLQNCVQCENNFQCESCIYQHFFNKDTGKCQLCGQYCLLCKSLTECVQCENGYFLNQDKGYCNTCEEIIPYCENCMEDKKIQDQIEQNNPLGKGLQKSSIVCAQCQSGYVRIKQGSCRACVSNCKVCENINQCKVCEMGYILNPSNSLCQECKIINCLVCNTPNQCLKCQNRYFWDNITYPEYPSCQKCRIGCQSCGINYCTSCEKGYYLDDKRCLKCSSECVTCSKQSDLCLGCLTGYYFVQSIFKCFKCPSPCLKCSSNQICTECAIGYFLSNRTCIKCQTKNCTYCQPNNFTFSLMDLNKNQEHLSSTQICYSCLDQFFLKENICHPCKIGCHVCQDAQKCLSCIQYYYLEYNSSQCKKCPQHCIECSKNDQQIQIRCLRCENGYFAQNNKNCLKCPFQSCLNCDHQECFMCKEGFYLNFNNLACIQCPQSCQNCINHQQCASCETGLYLSSNLTCQKCAEGCSSCQNLQHCLSCNFGFMFNSSQKSCKPCQTNNCAVCSHNIENCQRCFPGFTFQNNLKTNNNQKNSSICFKCGSDLLLGCIQCDSSVKCSSCIDGYVLNEESLCQKQNSSKWPFILVICVLSFVLLIVLGMKLKKKLATESISEHFQMKKSSSNNENYCRLEELY